MKRTVILAALALMLLAPSSASAQSPTRLTVRAVWAGDGARVSWPHVAGAAVVSVGRPGGQQPLGAPLSPTATTWRQGRTSLDVGLALLPGDAVEVRIWSASGELLASGEGRLRWAVYVPVARRR